MNTATLNIAISVDDKGSIKIRELGNEAKTAGEKGEKSFAGMRGQVDKLKGSTDITLGSIGNLAKMSFAAGVAGLAALTAGMVASLGAASNLQETQSKFDVVFSGQKGQAEAWAAELVAGYAMSTRESKQYLASVQDLLVPMGMMPDAAARMSSEVVKLSADLGSFNNLPTAQVMDDIQSALVGEYDTMKKYGVVLNAATVEQQALTMGLAATKDELTAGDKAQAAYALMVEASSAAIGDMARTGEGYANQMKSFHAITEDLTAAMGEKLLPIAADVLGKINSGMRDNAGSVDNLATILTTKLLQGLDLVLTGVEYLHVGWAMLQSVIPVVANAMVEATTLMFGGLRTLLFPLDGIFIAMEKAADFMGTEFINPLDTIQQKMNEMGSVTQGVMEESFQSIIDVHGQYDKLHGTIDGYITQVQKSAKEETAAGATIQAVHQQTGDAAVKIAEETGVKVTKARQKTVDDAHKLSTDLTEKINKETLSKYDYAVWALDQEVAAYRVKAAGDQEIMAQITEFQRLELAKIQTEYGVTNTAIGETYAALHQAVTGSSGSMTGMFADMSDNFGALETNTALTLGDTGMASSFTGLHTDVTGSSGSMTGLATDVDAVFDAMQAKVATTVNTGPGSMVETFEDYVTSVDGLTADLTDNFRLDFENIGGMWTGLWQGMVQTVVQSVAKIVASKAASVIVDTVAAVLFHDGTTGVKEDEVDARLQVGEAIIPRDDAAIISKNLSPFGYGGGDSTDFSSLTEATAVYRAVMEGGGADNARGYAGGAVGDLGGLDSSAAKAAVTSALSMGINAALGFGVNVGLTAANFGTKTTLGVVGHELGIDDNNVSDIGRTLGAIAGAMLGPLGSMIGSLVGGWLGSQAAEIGITTSYDRGDANSGYGSDIGDNADGGGDMGRGGSGATGPGNDSDNHGDYAHTGGYLLKADEGRIIAQTGEGVLSRAGMRNLDKLNSGELSGNGDDSVLRYLGAANTMIADRLDKIYRLLASLESKTTLAAART